MSLEPNNAPPEAMDDHEPRSGVSPVPILLIGLFAMLAYWGMVYLENHGGGFHGQVYPPYGSFDELSGIQPHDAVAEARELGKRKFSTVCAACHQPTGMGSPALGAPPLAGSDWVQAAGPNRIIRIVLNGLNGPIHVNGGQGEYGTTAMLPLKDTFKDDEIAEILTYIRSEWGNKADPVTAEQVVAIRKQVAARPSNWTAPELQKIPDKD